MDQLAEGLFKLLFKFEIIPIEGNEYAVIIFALGCAIMGILTVIADLSFFLIREESLFGLRHGLRNTSTFTGAWALGALIIGYLGQVINIFQVSLLACATVGISWPIIFIKILGKVHKVPEHEDEQGISMEE